MHVKHCIELEVASFLNYFDFLVFNLGDTVVYQYGIATVIIEANDDPNGVFSLEPVDKAVEEGKTNAFWYVYLDKES